MSTYDERSYAINREQIKMDLFLEMLDRLKMIGRFFQGERTGLENEQLLSTVSKVEKFLHEEQK